MQWMNNIAFCAPDSLFSERMNTSFGLALGLALFGSPFCWQGSPFGSHFTQNWIPMACGFSEHDPKRIRKANLGWN